MGTIVKEEQETVMQASNIDEQGNVLYLDRERLDAKVIPFKRYKNRPNGIGFYNFIKEHVIYLNDKRWKIARWLYNLFIDKAKWLKQGGWKAKLYKKVTMLDPDMERNTGTVILPLNVDISEKGEKVVVPMELLKASLKNVSYIGGMDTCLCRESNGCADFPHDLGCLFLGDAGRTAVKHNLGREFTYEEACARIDRAAELGLMAQAVWIEFEQILWGVRNDQMDSFMEICFCCPCCCIALRLSEDLTEKERFRFHPSGWTAVPDRTKCVGCKRCITKGRGCPMEAIRMGEDGKVVIEQDACVGCGLCKVKCPVGAIQLKQTMPMREGLKEYFDQEFNVGLRLWRDQEQQ